MTFGEKVQQLRKRRGWTQEELAGRIGVARQTLSKWESGAAAPDTENVVKLSDLFGVTTDYLLRENAEEPAVKPAEPAGTGRKPRPLLFWGWTVIALGLAGVLILGILASVSGCEVYLADQEAPVMTGLWAYLVAHHLRWLLWLLVGDLLVGAALLSADHERKK